MRPCAAAKESRTLCVSRWVLSMKHFIDKTQRETQSVRDSFAAAHGRIAMHDFLQHFGVSDQTILRSQRPLDQHLSFGFMRMCSPDQIHRDVGIDEGHSSK